MEGSCYSTPSAGGQLANIATQQLEQEGLEHLLMLSLPGTLTLSLVMILESLSLSLQAVMQQRFGLRAEANRQLLALAWANLVSARVGGLHCTGSRAARKLHKRGHE